MRMEKQKEKKKKGKAMGLGNWQSSSRASCVVLVGGNAISVFYTQNEK